MENNLNNPDQFKDLVGLFSSILTGCYLAVKYSRKMLRGIRERDLTISPGWFSRFKDRHYKGTTAVIVGILCLIIMFAFILVPLVIITADLFRL